MSMMSVVPLLCPSLPWLEELARRASDDEDLHRLGAADVTVELQMGDHAYRLAFDGWDVHATEGEGPTDFVLAGPLSVWKDLVERTQQGDHTHSLNSLVASGALDLRGDEQLGVDCFYRYNATLQRFFELTATIPCVFRKS